MKSITSFWVLCLLLSYQVKAQRSFPSKQLSINFFRNPSIGLEYQQRNISLHGGYYITNFESGITTSFLKAGASYWFLPWGKQVIPSACYVGTSYLYGLDREYSGEHALALEAGARLMIWKGFQFRLGVIALAAPNHSIQINPTPSFNYSIAF